MEYKHFSLSYRIELSILLKRGYSLRSIAAELKINHSSISREIRRNSVDGIYNPLKADHKSYVRRRGSKYQGMTIETQSEIKKLVIKSLKQHWTPEQISGHFRRQKGMRFVSHVAIYKWLYSSFGQRYCHLLPLKHYSRKKRKASKKHDMKIPERVSISERPSYINARTVFGHLEGDTLGAIRSDASRIAGIQERKSRKLFLQKVTRLKYTVKGFKKVLNPYSDVFMSLTLDNGVENISYKELKIMTYFCRPFCSGDKGGIENSFKRLRRFIKKKSSIRNLTDRELSKIVRIMNNTPRKCLNFKTPNQVFRQELLKARQAQS